MKRLLIIALALTACGGSTPASTPASAPATTVTASTVVTPSMSRDARLAVQHCQDAITSKTNVPFANLVATEAAGNNAPHDSGNTLTTAQEVCHEAAIQIDTDSPAPGSAEDNLSVAIADIATKLVALKSLVSTTVNYACQEDICVGFGTGYDDALVNAQQGIGTSIVTVINDLAKS